MGSTGCPPRKRVPTTAPRASAPTCAGVTITAEEEPPMLNSSPLDKLSALRLHAMAQAWQAQQAHPDHAALSFDERFGLLVDVQWLARENRRLQRSLREAKLRLAQASLEAIEHYPQRPLDKALLRQLATGRWIAAHHNVVVTGPTGTGKTFVACALAHQACRTGSPVPYRPVPP